MGLFRPAEVTTAYLKMAFMGFQGSGKTYTATETAIGLVLLLRELNIPLAAKPIAFADTEKGSDWILPRVKGKGVDMVTAKTRAFTDLLGLVKEAQESASVLLIDSLTHYWTELCDTYCAKKAREYNRATYRLQFQDWAYLKAEWRKFTDLFVNSSLHIIACGRAGYEYDYIEDEDTKKKQLEKTGIKLKAEGEMGYEPDLLVLMERRMNMDTKADEHIAHVLKDRSALLDGKEFSEPTFKDFLPHIQRLNLGGKHMGVDATRTSAASIPADAPRDKMTELRTIVTQELDDLLLRHGAGGTGETSRKLRSDLLHKCYGTGAKLKIESMPLSELRGGFDALHRELEGKPSHYSASPSSPPSATAGATGRAVEIGDRLPDHSAPPPVVVETVAMTAENGTMIDLRDPVTLGEAAQAVVAKARKRKAAEVVREAEDAARSAPAMPLRGNGVLGGETWGTD